MSPLDMLMVIALWCGQPMNQGSGKDAILKPVADVQSCRERLNACVRTAMGNKKAVLDCFDNEKIK